MPISPAPASAVNSLMKMDSPVTSRERPPRILVFMTIFVDMVAMADASTFSVWPLGTWTVR